jgi:NAD(P)-dependent dehydrogenase (short-subunit alcohol dehydrogenase family)
MARSARPSRRALLAASPLAAAAAPALAAEVLPAGALKGRTVLITGASSGFGRLTALHLAGLGAHVIASMRNLQKGRRPEAASLKAEASGLPGRLDLVEIDVTRPDQVVSGVAAAERLAGGGLDVLVSNAGIGLSGPLELHDEAALEAEFQTNLLGGLRMARAVLPGMRARKAGLILPVSSQLGRIVMPNMGGYCSGKWGLEAAFEAMAYELAPFGVEVTIVQPGGYPTRIWETGSRAVEAMIARNEPERVQAYAQHVAMTRASMTAPRRSDPMDVARAIAGLIALPAGDRPLRQPVHPDTTVTTAVNKALSDVQDRVLSRGPYAAWRAAVSG